MKAMRSEKEMMERMLTLARADDRVRAVYMNGSRTNPNAPKDMYRDYDLVFVVTETASFLADPGWSLKFGDPLIVQEPDWNDAQSGLSGEAPDSSRGYAWLMLFDDGNRIDLSIVIREDAVQNFLADKLTVPLLDKDGLLPAIPPPTDIDYHVKRPTEHAFHACCNDFWWCLNNVAKGIAREELPYAMRMLHEIVRNRLDQIVEWYIGIHTDFSVSAGKMGKYFKDHLPPELYWQYCGTYSGADADAVWKSVDTMCDLFHTLALAVAGHQGFRYRQEEEDGMRKYLIGVRNGAWVVEEADKPYKPVGRL